VEVETQLLIAQNLGYFTPEHGKQLLDRAAELGRILNGLIASIRPAA
jgi:four helix bundle protein